MRQRQKPVLAFAIACVLCVQSFVIWSGILSGSVYNLRLYVIEGRGREQPSFIKGVEDLFLVPTKKEPEVKLPEEKITRDVGERRQAQRELEQWGIKRWFTISIPSINVRAPVFLPSRKYWDERQWNLLEEQMQVALLRGASAYPHSVNPGEEGSLFIAGHSSPPNERAQQSEYGRVFQLLPSVKRGDIISIAGGGTLVSYKVVGSEVVKPEQTQILAQQGGNKLLKLITCYPVGSTKERLVVTAAKMN